MVHVLRRARRLLACVAALALAPVAPLATAADPAKVLHVAFSIAETSFDPAFASDAASDGIIANVFDAMLDYDYLARPVKLVPRALEALPEVADGGRTYICRVKKGIYFTPDPAFKGKRRELTAADFAYGFERILDPAVKSPWLWLLDGKLAGGDEARAKAQETGRFDYDAPLPGLEVVDRYTLRIHLKSPDLRFPYALAVPNMAAQAREVVEAYGNDIGAHPVGTGPYKLGEYRRSTRIVLEANPDFRPMTYTPAGPIPATSQPAAAALKGRALPIAGRIEISVIEEGQARFLAFMNREIDLLDILPIEFTEQALDANGGILPALAAKGIVHDVLLRPNTWWTYFNMKDPVVGGYTPEKIALRRAIGMGYNNDEAIRVLLKGRATPAKGPIPPDIAGYDPALKTDAQVYDPVAARALLDKFGYKDRDGDGYREAPDGKPLTLERWSTPNSAARQGDELWERNMKAIGLRMVFKKDRVPELRKMARLGKIPMRGDGWNADYPDAENFMQLLYGPNAYQANESLFDLPEYNKLFEEARALPDGPARTKLFDRMTQLVIAYAPFRMTYHVLEDSLRHPWVGNYVPHPIRSQVWMYVDVKRHA
ncbi:MAG TPA: ABC transporter substrate-binding protein [Casimicrobiaceae bacterium]|jgi:oligopeptide transport system substrate-binding protein|nr:ABC transporter substrate-binding protein [Casimicrobiaceae bacterium]